MQVAPSGGQICKKCKWCHLVAKFGTYASGAIWWPNLELMQVEPPLAGEITQVRDAIPWVRCASGNVSFMWVSGLKCLLCLFFKNLNNIAVVSYLEHHHRCNWGRRSQLGQASSDGVMLWFCPCCCCLLLLSCHASPSLLFMLFLLLLFCRHALPANTLLFSARHCRWFGFMV